LAGSSEEERKGERRPGAAGFAAAPAGRSREEEERKGMGVRLTGGAGSSARERKKKKRSRGVGCRGEELVGRWAAGLEGGNISFSFFLFFFKLISNQF
jgi:hypothetical protein